MIHIVKDWYSRCSGCGEIKENTLVMISPGEYSNVTGSLTLCPKCRRDLIKKLVVNKED